MSYNDPRKTWLFAVYPEIQPAIAADKSLGGSQKTSVVEISYNGKYFKFSFEDKSFRLYDLTLLEKLTELFRDFQR